MAASTTAHSKQTDDAEAALTPLIAVYARILTAANTVRREGLAVQM
jgi:hypothetical protein